MVIDNNGFGDAVIFSGVVFSVCVPFWRSPGFAIPLVKSRVDSNITYVQRVDRDRRVVGYDLFEGETRSVDVDPLRRTGIGGLEIFALVAPNAVAHAGTRSELSPIVKEWVHKIERPLLRLNFALFCGEQEVASRAALEAVKEKTAEFGSEEGAIRWFVDSVVAAELVRIMTRPRKGGRLEGRDGLINEIVSVNLKGKYNIGIGVSKEMLASQNYVNRRYRADLASLLGLVRVATGRNVDIEDVDRSRPHKRGGSSTRRAERLVESITRQSRQEERLALVLRYLIDDMSTGKDVLEIYSDRAVFARNSIRYIGDRLNFDGTDDIEFQISKLIPEIVKSAYPMQKGQLLLDFARILGDSGIIAQVIRIITMKSSAYNVIVLKDLILSELR